MKKALLTLLSALLGSAAIAAAPAPAAAPSAAKQLLQDAQKLARDSKSDLAAVSNAYAQALAATDLDVTQRVTALADLARFHGVKGQREGAAALFDQAAAVEGATPALRAKALTDKAQMWFRSNFEGAFASYFTVGIDKAIEAYRQILAFPDCPNDVRIAAYQGLSNGLLEKGDTTGANAALDEALKLPGLTERERFDARRNQADALYRQLEFAQALPVYESLWSTNLPANVRNGIEGRIVELVWREKGPEEAYKVLQERFRAGPMALAAFCGNSGRQAEAIALYDGVLADAKADARTRIEALEKLLYLFADNPDFAAFKANAERRIDPLVAADPKALAVYRTLGSYQFARTAVSRDPAFPLWLREKQGAAPSLPPREVVAANTALFEGSLKQYRLDQAMAAAGSLLADTNTPAETRLACSLARIIFDSKGRPAGAVNKVKAALDQDEALRTNPVARAEALLKSATIAMNMRHDEVAKALYAERGTMLVPEPRRTLACPFIPNGPKTITEIMQSPLYKDSKNHGRLDRKYGDNLQFLLDTDAAMTGRKVTGAEAGFIPAEFVAFCDEDGVKILLFAPSAKGRAVADGLVGMGGYEMYLGAGQVDPYDCYLVDVSPGGENGVFNTQYNNASFRCTRLEDQNLAIEHRLFDNGVATLVAVSWKAYFNRLPGNGDAWDFEPIHWEQGGYSWGGSKSVHNRSSFGALVFENLTPENRNAIRRRLVAASARVYRAALSPNNGCVEIWQDPELGDQAFYAEVIKPLQARLSSYLPKVKPEMTAADVDEVFTQAAQEWMNIEYVVAALRRDYLDARRIAGK